jgi:hypothetical protein
VPISDLIAKARRSEDAKGKGWIRNPEILFRAGSDIQPDLEKAAVA